MAKPPPSGPHSDLTGVNRDARVNVPTRDAKHGTAKELHDADRLSAGQSNETEGAGSGK